MDPSRCLVLVPATSHIEPECEQSLRGLERLGYPVWRMFGSSAIDQARNQMATAALAKDFDELMWIDSDIRFPVEAVEQLREHDLPIVGGIYPKKGARKLTVRLLPGTDKLVFGIRGGLVEVCYAATGFLLTKRCVYEKVAIGENLPECNKQFEDPVLPYFMPMILDADGENPWYLGEDFAFCERARRNGFQVFADTRIRLQHIGKYGYSWEDAGSELERFGTYNFRLR